MFTKVSEQRSAARRYALSKVAAGPTYNTGGWAPPAVARIPKTETPNYWPEHYALANNNWARGERAGIAFDTPGYTPFDTLMSEPEFTPARLRAKADPRYGNWFSAHNEALKSLPVNEEKVHPFVDFSKLPKTREALARAYHGKMYELTNGVPTRASAIYTR